MDTEKKNPNLIPSSTDSENTNLQNESYLIELDMKDERNEEDEKKLINQANEPSTLFLKYRSKNFQEIIGQDVTVQTLTMGILRKKLGHAFIFSGIRGTGKTSLARILAKSFNCEVNFSEVFSKFIEGSAAEGTHNSAESPNVSSNTSFSTSAITSTPSLEAIDIFLANNQIPCGKCSSCNEKNNIDIIEIDAASNTGVDDIRKIIDSAQYKPAISKYKVFIIDEVHMLSKSAFNALLKILEEPPAHVKFIFATTEIDKVPSTILSRCMKFHLNRVEKSKIAKHLRYICKKEGCEVQSEEDSVVEVIDSVQNSPETLIGRSVNSLAENFTEKSVQNIAQNITQNSKNESKNDSKANAKIDNKAIDLIAQHGHGSVRDAISILSQAILFCNGSISIEKVREMLCTADFLVVKKVFIALLNGNLNELMDSFAAIRNSNPIIFLSDLIDLCGDCIKYKISRLTKLTRFTGEEGSNNVNERNDAQHSNMGTNNVRSSDAESNDARENTRYIDDNSDTAIDVSIDMDIVKNLDVDASELMRLWDMLVNGGEDIKKTFNPNDSLEIVLIKCAYIKNSISPEKLIKTLNGLNNSGRDGGTSASGHGSHSGGDYGDGRGSSSNSGGSSGGSSSNGVGSSCNGTGLSKDSVTKFDIHELENIAKSIKKDIYDDFKSAAASSKISSSVNVLSDDVIDDNLVNVDDVDDTNTVNIYGNVDEKLDKNVYENTDDKLNDKLDENMNSFFGKHLDKQLGKHLDKHMNDKQGNKEKVNLKSFKDLIMHVRKSREPLLYSFLLNDFYLISFESGGKMRFFANNNLNLVSDLKNFLEATTEIKWNLEFLEEFVVKGAAKADVKEFGKEEFVESVEEAAMAEKFKSNFEQNNVSSSLIGDIAENINNNDNNELRLNSPKAPALLYSFADIDQNGQNDRNDENDIIIELKSILSENDYSIVDVDWEME